MDNEQQKDELIALESIYNQEEFSYRKENELYEVTLKIFISLPEKYFFIYKDNRKSDQRPEKVYISHVPPLTLLITLPLDYPSTSPPKFTLRSSWLNPSSISKLCKELDQLWESNKGQEILFTWIGFLQSETLECLNIQECFNIDHVYTFYKKTLEKAQKAQELASEGEKKSANQSSQSSRESEKKVQDALTVDSRQKDKKTSLRKKFRKAKNRRQYDQRAIADIIVGRNPVQMLIDYNELRNQIEFRKNFYSCKICFTDKLGEHSTQFLPCTHVFCKECIMGYFESKIKDGTVTNILCPEEKCKSEATPGQIKDLVSPELFSKYDSILLSATLDTMTDIIYCPRKSCQYPVSREPNEIMANCPVCQYAFCIFCKAVYHGIEPCKVNTVEKKNLVKEYQEATDERKAELEQRYGKKQLQVLVENTMSENWIHRNSQSCPHCNAAIEKSDGCNKMVCWKCNTFFCWTCNTKLNRDDPYLHYRDPHSRCFNKLYHGLLPDEEDDDDDDFIDFDFAISDEEDEDDDDFDEDDVLFVLNY
ncbi:hypothetical protein TSAR_005079 [Trichomalopsis sarcophagae]|uniref:RBR-type E3 ubiquitin transferase n=1 Tax=Trichomalopsis sarcophagae TaxID=543379 RepID=A0A232EVK7_9HYME|nr:hypothetical protein TSAR_005079 [Trichomalopsis sarcophagae]